MNCSFDQHLLQDYLENTIEPLEKLILIEHLKVCKICRHELTELKLLYWEFNNLSNVDIPFEAENIKESVLADIHTSDTYNKNKPYYSLKDYISIQTSKMPLHFLDLYLALKRYLVY